ncbi:MAG: protein kinase [Pirellulales bacterium]
MPSITTTNVSRSPDSRLAQAVDEFLARRAAGDDPSVADFVERYPDIASVLPDVFQALDALTAMDDEPDSSDVAVARSRTLGDYRLIRELGRGGMGIVYEAEQLSLARRVALKILPFAAVLDPRHLQRFKNEALAAAHLDHPNIVEVYAVGCERGVHFYAMRYIEGQTLAEVIEALRLAAAGTTGSAVGGTPTLECGDSSPLSFSKGDGPREDATLSEKESDDKASHSKDTLAAALTTLRTQRPKDFFRRVAELGIQAAEGLDHAHQMGIVHRDIKPSNLMIECSRLAPRDGARGKANNETPMSHHAERDNYTSLNPEPRLPAAAGTLNPAKLWITDFGLARIESDVSLTMTGDLIGTLRYMSPEQAEGKATILDHRTDIYSLGITLYELLALRPAFPSQDRQTLLKQIAKDQPAAPRKLNPLIPADLETIILKSIAKDAAERYQSVGHLADDLRRFVEQKPIKARPPTFLQRAARWSRRHVLWLSGLAAALGAITAVLTSALILLWQANHETHSAVERANKNEKVALVQRKLAEKSEQSAWQLLYASEVADTFRTLELSDSRRIRSFLEQFGNKRSINIARSFEWHYLSAHGNYEPVALVGHEHDVYHVSFSHDGRLIATTSKDGTARIWNSSTGTLIHTLIGHTGEVNNAEFLSQSTELVTAGDDGTVRFWDVESGRHLRSFEGHTDSILSLAVAPGERWIATAGKGGDLRLWDLKAGNHRVTSSSQAHILCLAFHPSGEAIAIGTQSRALEIWSAPELQRVKHLQCDAAVYGLSFLPTGKMISVALAHFSVQVLNWPELQPVVGLFEPDACAVGSLPNARGVVAGSMRGRLTLWEYPWMPNQALRPSRIYAHSNRIWCVAASPVDHRIATASADRIAKVWHPYVARPRRLYVPHAVRQLHFSDSRTLAVTSKDGEGWRWNLRTGDLLAEFLKPAEAEVTEDRQFLYDRRANGSVSVRNVADHQAVWNHQHVLDPQLTPFGRSRDSSTFVFATLVFKQSGRFEIYDSASGTRCFTIPAHNSPRSVVFSPDSRVVLLHSDGELAILDLNSGNVRRPDALQRAKWRSALFSPDGHWLLLIDLMGHAHLLSFPKLKTVASIDGVTFESATFSPDGHLIALGSTDASIMLWQIATKRTIAVLETDREMTIEAIAFSPDSRTLAAGGWNPKAGGTGLAYVWSSEPGIEKPFENPWQKTLGP